jgi:hypothetical protein
MLATAKDHRFSMQSSLSFCSSISERDANGLQSRWLASSLWLPVSSTQLPGFRATRQNIHRGLQAL